VKFEIKDWNKICLKIPRHLLVGFQKDMCNPGKVSTNRKIEAKIKKRIVRALVMFKHS
jgi:hypothetical protein